MPKKSFNIKIKLAPGVCPKVETVQALDDRQELANLREDEELWPLLLKVRRGAVDCAVGGDASGEVGKGQILVAQLAHALGARQGKEPGIKELV